MPLTESDFMTKDQLLSVRSRSKLLRYLERVAVGKLSSHSSYMQTTSEENKNIYKLVDGLAQVVNRGGLEVIALLPGSRMSECIDIILTSDAYAADDVPDDPTLPLEEKELFFSRNPNVDDFPKPSEEDLEKPVTYEVKLDKYDIPEGLAENPLAVYLAVFDQCGGDIPFPLIAKMSLFLLKHGIDLSEEQGKQAFTEYAIFATCVGLKKIRARLRTGTDTRNFGDELLPKGPASSELPEDSNTKRRDDVANSVVWKPRQEKILLRFVKHKIIKNEDFTSHKYFDADCRCFFLDLLSQLIKNVRDAAEAADKSKPDRKRTNDPLATDFKAHLKKLYIATENLWFFVKDFGKEIKLVLKWLAASRGLDHATKDDLKQYSELNVTSQLAVMSSPESALSQSLTPEPRSAKSDASPGIEHRGVTPDTPTPRYPGQGSRHPSDLPMSDLALESQAPEQAALDAQDMATIQEITNEIDDVQRQHELHLQDMPVPADKEDAEADHDEIDFKQNPQEKWYDGCFRWVEHLTTHVEAIQTVHVHSREKRMKAPLKRMLPLTQVHTIEVSASYQDLKTKDLNTVINELQIDVDSRQALLEWLKRHTAEGMRETIKKWGDEMKAEAQRGAQKRASVTEQNDFRASQLKKIHDDRMEAIRRARNPFDAESTWDKLKSFKGTMHCEVIMLTLHSLMLPGMLSKEPATPQEVHEYFDKRGVSIDVEVLHKLRSIGNTMAVSKRCCPACHVVVDAIRNVQRPKDRIVYPGWHQEWFEVVLPPWTPRTVGEALLVKMEDEIRARAQNIAELEIKAKKMRKQSESPAFHKSLAEPESDLDDFESPPPSDSENETGKATPRLALRTPSLHPNTSGSAARTPSPSKRKPSTALESSSPEKKLHTSTSQGTGRDDTEENQGGRVQ